MPILSPETRAGFPHAAARRLALVACGFLLAIVQGHGAAQAADLPQVLTGVNARFQGADLPVVSGNTMVVNQVADRATLHWQSFDIGAGHGVEFRQPSGNSVALNRIFDGKPSEIRGRLTANGQIYLINGNGIVFGDGAEVNTQSLVASTLDIDDQVYEEIGFVNAINDPSGPIPAFDSRGRPMGEIRLEPGAKLDAARTGRILIFAPKIVNEGTIRTPEGQQVLAGVQDRVLIAASDDPDLRGLLVEVSTGGEVTNLGSLIAERGSISLLGLAVNQEGVARATTSVSLNGSIRLLAQDMDGALDATSIPPRLPFASRGGELRVGAGSVTEVVPDPGIGADGKEVVAVDAQAQPQSAVTLAGATVRIGTGARVASTGGTIAVTAASNPRQPQLAVPGDPADQASELVVEQGAVIDASGDDSTVVPVTRNVVEVEARGNELADSPLQRDGPIRNETLKVDIRRGTDFLGIDGAVAGIARTARERQSAGGSVTLLSEGRLVLEDGASVDVGGGRVRYTEGLVATSRLRQSNGTVVEISAADKDQAYLGLVDDLVVREAGYVEGKDAGSLTIRARGLDLAGDIRAASLAGINQRFEPGQLGSATPAFARPWDQVPLQGALALSLLGPRRQGLVLGEQGTVAPGVVPPLVIPSDRPAGWGAGRIGIANAGPVTVSGALTLAPWSTLTLAGTEVHVTGDLRIAGGNVGLNSTNDTVGETVVPDEDLLVRVDGRIDLGGTWVNDNPVLVRGQPIGPVVLDGGSLAIRSGSSIEVTAGSRLDVDAGAWRAADGRFRGGAGGSLFFATGAVSDDPAFGSRLDLGGELRGFGFGDGGSLEIRTERIRVVPADAPPDDGDVRLDGSRQFALTEVTEVGGGRQFFLDVGARAFQQGGFDSYRLVSSRNDLEVTARANLWLRAASLQLSGLSPALTPTGTSIEALAAPVFRPEFQRRPSRLELAADEVLGNTIGAVAALRIAAGAVVLADAGSTVRLAGTTGIVVDGTIVAPAGSIELDLGDGPPTFQPGQMIRLGGRASLDVRGTARVDTLDPLGLRRGEVLDGGRVRLRATQGSLVGEAGSRIVADGAVADIDTGLGLPLRREVASAGGTIELAAAESLLWLGSLSAAAPAGHAVPGGRLTIALDPTDRGVPQLVGFDGIPRGPHRLVVGDFAGALPGPGESIAPEFYTTGFVPLGELRRGGFAALDLVVRSSATGTNDIGAPVPDTPESLPVIEFPDDVDLSLARSIRADAAVLSTAGARVALSAPYVGIGYGDARVRLDGSVPDKTSATNPQENDTPLRLTPTPGAGSLRVSGNLVELVGEVVTQGFGDTSAGSEGVVLESSGDLRVRGVRKRLESSYEGLFRTTGKLLVEARRVYPTTLTEFEIGVEGPGGQAVILGGGGSPDDVPPSVGGALELSAERIVQGGALFAPLGELRFDAGSSLRFTPGSLTSTTAAGLAAPFFRTEPGGALILPAPGVSEDQVVFVETVANPEFERVLPEKRIRISAPDVDLQPGSRFDLRGGGEVAATEFVPGPGGSRDILLADLDTGTGVEANGSFAILPGVGEFAPYDPLETPDAENVQQLRIGDSLLLEDGVPGLAAGRYAILPARYALFGGFLVTPEEGFRDLAPGQSLRRLDGAPILAGRYAVAGGRAADDRSLGFAVESGQRVRQRAEYLETPLDGLYRDAVARAPRDAGNLVIEAGDRLGLSGELVRDAGTGGLGSAVDIATDAALAIVREPGGFGGIELRAADLAGLGADSLLIGGTRAGIAGGIGIDAAAGEIVVAPGVDLDLPELLLVGSRIVIGAGDAAPTRLTSSRDATADSARLQLTEDAAVVGISSRRLELDRGSGGAAGVSSLAVAAQASLEAGGGIVLDAAGDVDAAGDLRVRDGVLSLGAARISVGATDGQDIDDGLVLSNADLSALAGSDLVLRSRGLVDLYGALGDAGGVAPAFTRLVVDAPGIRGIANDGVTATLVATTITLGNRSGIDPGAAAGLAAPGSALELRAGEVIELGEGSVVLRGLDSVRLAAGEALLLGGDGALRVDGDLAIESPVVTASGTNRSAVSATGALSLHGGAPATAPAGDGLGSALTLTGADVAIDGRIVLPSGNVSIAGSTLRIGAAAVVDVSGESRAYGPKLVGTPGGAITLRATAGDLDLASGALLDASGAGGGEAGAIRLAAPAGAVRLAAGLGLRARDDAGTTGSFELDAGTLVAEGGPGGNALPTLGALLDAGGFRESLSLRLRGQDLVVEAGQALRAGRIRLVADTGAIGVAGSLDATASRPGAIWLAAGDGLDVSGALAARSTATGARGGRVDLFALDPDGDDPDGVTDVVRVLAGSSIDVSGGEDGAGGGVFLHTRRLDTDSDGQTDRLLAGEFSGTVTGTARSELIATRVLRDPGAVQLPDPTTGEPVTRVTIDAATIEGWRSESEIFLGALAEPATGPLAITAGLQVESTGDIVLQDPWNFREGWHFGEDLSDPFAPKLGKTGLVTLRAARELGLQANLTDAFSQQFLFPGFLDLVVDDQLATAIPRYDATFTIVEELAPRSWGYRLAAGADLASADVMAVGSDSHGLTLASDVRVRTGTDDIDIAVSGDVLLRSGAAVYSAGWDRGLSQDLQQAIAPSGSTAFDFFASYLNGGQFPTAGGAVTLVAGGDVVAEQAPAAITSWLTRIGSGVVNEAVTLYGTEQGYGAIPTHWAVAFREFRNGVGAFGGGDLRIAAGGIVANVVAATPTTGRVIDGVVADTTSFPGRFVFLPSARRTEVLGAGGSLSLRAGGDVDGGQIVAGSGTAVVRALGATGTAAAPVIAIGGDARIDWLATRGLDITPPRDPTSLPLDESQLRLVANLGPFGSLGTIDNRFYTYGDAARATLASLSGDVNLRAFELDSSSGSFLPPTLVAVALGGNLGVEAPLVDFFPSPIGQLELVARDDVRGVFDLTTFAFLRQSDQDRNVLPSVDRPDRESGQRIPARVPVHTGDDVPNLIIARDGSIRSVPGTSGFWTLDLAKPAIVQAGTDISSIAFRVQHIAPTSLSAFRAGRDIVQGDLRENTGRFEASDQRIFEISGPGSAEFIAGRDISLGTSAGIESIGNTRNPALSPDGAALRLLAGTGGEPSYDRFIDVYLSTAPSEYREALNDFLAEVDAGRAGFTTSSGKATQAIEPGEAGFALDELDEAAAALTEPADDPAALAQALRQNAIPVVDDDPVATFESLEASVQSEVLTDLLTQQILDAAVIPVAGNDPSATFQSLDRALQRNLLTDAVITDFLGRNGIPVGEDGPLATFRSLDRARQRILIGDIVFRELGNWGSASETPDRADRLNYVRGFTAIDTLFEPGQPVGERAAGFAPGIIQAAVQDYLALADPQAANDAQVELFGRLFPPRGRQGDISLLLSQVQTLAGGSLSMLAPTGDINAGAADADIIDKEAADLGIVTARGGDIDIYVDRNLFVNSTRVFALQGDLLVWSSNGNIDAGKGAKTVTSVPDPITQVDDEGNTIIVFPPAVAGSGLQGVNAALFAPRGAVNAGDAGIRTSGDLTIGAVEIVGTDNIDVGGVEIGFSTSDVVAVAPPGAASASSAATKGMESQASMLSEANEQGERTIEGTQVSFVTVEVLSFGDGESGSCDPEKEDCD